ncbi:MAG: 2-oxoisovalerate dehydrogenase [Ignavibacterium sp.]
MKNKEIIFLIEESLEGGFEAKAVGYPIFTEGETEDEIRKNILEAVRCHFDDNEMPAYVNMRFLREEQIAL